MYQKIIFIIFVSLLTSACISGSSNDDDESRKIPPPKEKSFEIYQEAVTAMNDGQLLNAAEKFSEAEEILPQVAMSAKASLMSSFCYYNLNFFDEAEENLKRFISKYPADKNIQYAKYMLVIIQYEQILDEEKDITPLLLSKKEINAFIESYPNTDYALDLKFKLDLIDNQLAAKELYIAKYYISTQKWIPAINRLQVIVNDYDETIFIEEALHRLVEVYYKLGLKKEATSAAAILGYNYNSSKWYEKSYVILNKKYKVKKLNSEKKNGLISRTIKKVLNK